MPGMFKPVEKFLYMPGPPEQPRTLAHTSAPRSLIAAVVEQLKVGQKNLANNGWIKGTYRMGNSSGVSYCAIGALLGEDGEAGQRNEENPIVSHAAQELNHTTIGISGVMVTDWNDRRAQTKDEVLAMYQRTIDRLEAVL